MPARGPCPLCGAQIVAVKQYDITTDARMLYSTIGPVGMTRGHGGGTITVTWFCGNGCQVTVEGQADHVQRVPAVPADLTVTTDAEPEAPINENPELKAKAERAKAALEGCTDDDSE